MIISDEEYKELSAKAKQWDNLCFKSDYIKELKEKAEKYDEMIKDGYDEMM